MTACKWQLKIMTLHSQYIGDMKVKDSKENEGAPDSSCLRCLLLIDDDDVMTLAEKR